MPEVNSEKDSGSPGTDYPNVAGEGTVIVGDIVVFRGVDCAHSFRVVITVGGISAGTPGTETRPLIMPGKPDHSQTASTIIVVG